MRDPSPLLREDELFSFPAGSFSVPGSWPRRCGIHGPGQKAGMASGGNWLSGTSEQVPLEFRRRKPDLWFPELCLQHPQPIHPLQARGKLPGSELESDQRAGSGKGTAVPTPRHYLLTLCQALGHTGFTAGSPHSPAGRLYSTHFIDEKAEPQKSHASLDLWFPIATEGLGEGEGGAGNSARPPDP